MSKRAIDPAIVKAAEEAHKDAVRLRNQTAKLLKLMEDSVHPDQLEFLPESSDLAESA